MKALTIYQPWASLIIAGAKPVEFRDWNYLARNDTVGLLGRRIVIHAAARAIAPAEIMDLIARCKAGDTSLIVEKALPLLERIADAHQCKGVIEIGAGIGTAVIGTTYRVEGTFQKPDSDRLMHHQWAWPLSDPKPFLVPVPIRGQQGFWPWPNIAADLPKPEKVAS